MSRGASPTGPGHERAHDPTRADWHGWTAEHPAPPGLEGQPDPTDLAPYASTGGYSAYSFQGRAIQSANFSRALLGDRRGSIRVATWLALAAFVGLTAGMGIWHLVGAIS
jgi:hypothetical protein